MKVLDDLISALDIQVPVRDIRMGLFQTGVLTRHCGLAATLLKDALKQDTPHVRLAGSLVQQETSDLVKMVYSKIILEAAVGMATINSLLDVDEDACKELDAAKVILEKGNGKKVAIVGHFPFVKKVREQTEMLWIIEKNPRQDDFHEEEAEVLIPQADVVAITGTSLTNHSFEYLIQLCNPRAYVIMLGDTTPLSPILFDYGVDALSGTIVTDHKTALRCLSEGANFRQMKGIKKLTMFRK